MKYWHYVIYVSNPRTTSESVWTGYNFESEAERDDMAFQIVKDESDPVLPWWNFWTSQKIVTQNYYSTPAKLEETDQIPFWKHRALARFLDAIQWVRFSRT